MKRRWKDLTTHMESSSTVMRLKQNRRNGDGDGAGNVKRARTDVDDPTHSPADSSDSYVREAAGPVTPTVLSALEREPGIITATPGADRSDGGWDDDEEWVPPSASASTSTSDTISYNTPAAAGGVPAVTTSASADAAVGGLDDDDWLEAVMPCGFTVSHNTTWEPAAPSGTSPHRLPTVPSPPLAEPILPPASLPSAMQNDAAERELSSHDSLDDEQHYGGLALKVATGFVMSDPNAVKVQCGLCGKWMAPATTSAHVAQPCGTMSDPNTRNIRAPRRSSTQTSITTSETSNEPQKPLRARKERITKLPAALALPAAVSSGMRDARVVSVEHEDRPSATSLVIHPSVRRRASKPVRKTAIKPHEQKPVSIGRPPKYKTAEEREAARRDSRRSYYERNRENERQRARERYHASKLKAQAARVGQAKKETSEAPVLADTVAKFGSPITLGRDTSLQELVDTLSSDLERWRGSKHKNEGDVWDDLTCRLIAVVGRPRYAKGVLLDVARNSQLAALVTEHAEAGSNEAQLRGQDQLRAALDQLAHKSRTISRCLGELSAYFRDGGDALVQRYEDQTLLWQCIETTEMST